MAAKKVEYLFICAALTAFGIAFIIYPERYVNCCFEGFALWAECVLPSLFPFVTLALIFIKSGAAERASLPLKGVMAAVNLPKNAAVCFLISILSGYPAGSRTVAEFYGAGAVDKADCKKLAPLCSTSGPLFIIGSVGFKMFADKTEGIKIFIAHALAVIIVSLIYCKLDKSKPDTRKAPKKSRGNLLYDSFYGAVVSVAVAGGFIAFFYVLAQFFYDFKILYPLEKFLSLFLGDAAKGAAFGFMEVTTGCRFLAAAQSPLKTPVAGFLITFGGVSILAQQLCYLTAAGIKPAKFILCKFLQAALCLIILLPLRLI